MGDVDNDIEELMSHLGDFGKYQAWQFFLHIISGLTAGMHMMTLVTVAAVPDHRCAVAGVDLDNFTAPWNDSRVLEAIPKSRTGNLMLDSCHIFGPNKSHEPCESWVYDTTYYQSSRGMEWDFVCHRRWMGAVAQSAYMLGVFTGAVTLGSMADKYGRKTIFYVSSVAQLILGVSVALIPEYVSFLIVRFLYGIFGSAGAYITGFVLTMEIVGPSKRTICGVTFQAVFAGGVMLVAAWGSIIKDRMLLQIVYGLHSALLIGHWWLIDESPRWLWAQGRTKEALKIIKKALKMNNKSNVEIDAGRYLTKEKVRDVNETDKAYGVLDLFRTPNLRKKSLNVCLNWFANSIVYYGLSLNTGSLLGNPFLMLFLSGLVELPSYVVTVVLMDRTGRRSLISVLMILGGLCSIIAAYIPRDESGQTFVVTVAMLGKAFIAGSFAIIYNYSAELFPTVLRNTALGVGSMCARLSGAMTPLIMLLDTLDPRVPAVLFGCLALLSGFLSLYLPETLNQPMPQSLEDGEKFGVGDTAFASCFGTNARDRTVYEVALQESDKNNGKENDA